MPSRSATSFWVCSSPTAEAKAQGDDGPLPFIRQVVQCLPKQLPVHIVLDGPS